MGDRTKASNRGLNFFKVIVGEMPGIKQCLIVSIIHLDASCGQSSDVILLL